MIDMQPLSEDLIQIVEYYFMRRSRIVNYFNGYSLIDHSNIQFYNFMAMKLAELINFENLLRSQEKN